MRDGHAGKTFELVIDNRSPAVIPMDRLAQYILDLAQMTGMPDETRFRGIKKGSTRIAYSVPSKRVETLRENFWKLRVGSGNQAMAAARDRITARLREDGVAATIRDPEHAVVLNLDPDPAIIGEFDHEGLTQDETLKGTVVGIWDRKDRGISLELNTGAARNDTVSVPEALVAEAQDLYRRAVQVSGRARWRADQGQWKLVSFDVRSIRSLGNETAAETLQRARAILGDAWAETALDNVRQERTG